MADVNDSQRYRLRLEEGDQIIYEQIFSECPNVAAIVRAANPATAPPPVDGHLTGLREAALGILREATGEILSGANIWQQLAARGFAVDNSRHAGRALHAAFINCPEVERVGTAQYRYREELAETLDMKGG